MRRKHTLIIFICLLVIIKITAQQLTLQGVVRDTLNNPLPFVTITATIVNQKTIAAFAFSDDKGEYKLVIQKIDKDSLLLSASSLGLKKEEIWVVIEKGKSNYRFDFKISNEKYSLPTLTIKADKRDKIVRKDTITFKIKYYIDSTERVLEDVLKKLPGVVVKDDGSIEYKGKPIERILVEGDDLFNTNNKIPSKNLHASLIEDIQIIDRYSSNSLLKNIENSERQIINLNLKKDRKKALFGNITGGGGLTNRYDANTNLISFIDKLKFFGLGGLNNVGTNLGSDGIESDNRMNRFNNPDYYDPSVNSPNLIPISRLSAPNLAERRTNINQTQLASINFLTRPKEGWTLKAISLLSKDNISQQQNDVRQYLLGNNQFTVKEESEAKLKPIIRNFYLDNTVTLNKNANLKIINEYRSNQNASYSHININDKNIVQELSRNSSLWRNIFSLTTKVSDSTAIIFEGAYIKDNKPQSLTMIPKENYLSLINQPNLDFTSLDQNAQTGTEYVGLVMRLIRAWHENHKINLSIGGSIRNDRAFSAIYTPFNGKEQLFNDSNYINQVKYYTQDLFASTSYNWEIGDFNIGGKILLVQQNNRLIDNIDNTHNFSKNRFYATPRLSVKWKWNYRNSLSFSYSYKAKFAELNDVLGNYIFKDYRNLYRNTVAPYQINSHSITSLYRFDNSEKKWEGYLSLFYFTDKNTRSYHYKFSPFFVLTESSLQQKSNQNYLLYSQLLKFFPNLNLSYKLETNHSISSSFNGIENNTFVKNTQISNQFVTQIVSTYKGFFNFIIGTSFSTNQQLTKTNGQDVNPKFNQYQLWLKTNFRFNKKISFSVNNEYSTFKSPFGKNKNSAFTDVTGQFELKPSRLFLYLDLYNIFNVQQYSFTNIDVNQIATQSYILLPRVQVIKCEWRF